VVRLDRLGRFLAELLATIKMLQKGKLLCFFYTFEKVTAAEINARAGLR
jgi:hypothetical protein